MQSVSEQDFESCGVSSRIKSADRAGGGVYECHSKGMMVITPVSRPQVHGLSLGLRFKFERTRIWTRT